LESNSDLAAERRGNDVAAAVVEDSRNMAASASRRVDWGGGGDFWEGVGFSLVSMFSLRSDISKGDDDI